MTRVVRTRRAAAAAAAALCAALLVGGGAAANCGRRLEANPEEFAACKDGSTVCFFFKSEEPFIILPGSTDVDRSKLDALEKPFPCNQYAEAGLNGLPFDKKDKTMRLGGFGFAVLKTVTERANVSAVCFLAGPDCTFNELVEYLDNAADPAHPASGMLLGITGLLLFTPRRVALGISSAPVFEDKMIIVQRIGAGNSESVTGGVRGAWRAATRPFATNAWALCLSALVVLLVVVSIISLVRPTPFLKSKNLTKRNKCAQWVANFIRNTIGGSTDKDSAVERGFEPARMTLRLSLVAIIALTLIYYEAALIVGRSEPTLSRPVRGQSDRQLCSMVVLRDSALEESIAATVDSGRGENDRIDVENLHNDKNNEIRTWATCDKFGECFEMVEGNDPSNTESCDRYDAKVDYIVAYETVALHQFRREPKYCSSLELVQTQEKLFEFNGGWMYSRPANGTVHETIMALDTEIRKARRDGTTERLLTEAVGSEIDCPDRSEQVSVTLMLFPIVVALVGPVFFSVVLMIVFPLVIEKND